MSDRISNLLNEISEAAAALPGVFSAAQWGGRAFKLPGPGGDRRKPKLVAFVSVAKDRTAVSVSFKLKPERAAGAVSRFSWVEPHGFRTLAPSGWVNAQVTNKRQLGPLTRMLNESRSLYPQAEEPPVVETTRGGGGGSGTSTTARHIDRVMQDAKREGWTPPSDDDFEG